MNQVDLNALKKDFVLDLQGYKLINYLNLSPKDSLKILSFRNDSVVRTRMVNSDLIPEEDHFYFVSSLIKKNVGFWALKRNNKIVGSISLVEYDEAKESFVAGNFIDPKLIGSGFGAVINYFMHYVAFEEVKCEKIKAFVKKDNLEAIRINKFFGAVFTNESLTITKTNKDYVFLEFSSDLWQNKIKNKTRKIIQYVL